jgi:hypothetical protein
MEMVAGDAKEGDHADFFIIQWALFWQKYFAKCVEIYH